MKKQLLSMALAFTVLSTGISAAFANEGCKPVRCPQKIQKVKLTPEQRQAKFQEKIDKFDTALGLTDEQKVKAQKIRKDSKEKLKPLFEKKKELCKQIKETRKNDNIKIKVQDKKVEDLKAQIKLVDQEIRQVMQDSRNEFKSILTDEQKEKLVQLKKEQRKNFKRALKHRRHCGAKF